MKKYALHTLLLLLVASGEMLAWEEVRSVIF